MSSGERPVGAAKCKQSDTEALCRPPPPPGPPILPPQVATSVSLWRPRNCSCHKATPNRSFDKSTAAPQYVPQNDRRAAVIILRYRVPLPPPPPPPAPWSPGLLWLLQSSWRRVFDQDGPHAPPGPTEISSGAHQILCPTISGPFSLRPPPSPSPHQTKACHPRLGRNGLPPPPPEASSTCLPAVCGGLWAASPSTSNPPSRPEDPPPPSAGVRAEADQQLISAQGQKGGKNAPVCPHHRVGPSPRDRPRAPRPSCAREAPLQRPAQPPAPAAEPRGPGAPRPQRGQPGHPRGPDARAPAAAVAGLRHQHSHGGRGTAVDDGLRGAGGPGAALP